MSGDKKTVLYLFFTWFLQLLYINFTYLFWKALLSEINFGEKLRNMVLISYVKPNIVINSDKLINGKLIIYDENNSEMAVRYLYGENFASIGIKAKQGSRIKVVVQTEGKEIKKYLLI